MKSLLTGIAVAAVMAAPAIAQESPSLTHCKGHCDAKYPAGADRDACYAKCAEVCTGNTSCFTCEKVSGSLWQCEISTTDLYNCGCTPGGGGPPLMQKSIERLEQAPKISRDLSVSPQPEMKMIAPAPAPMGGASTSGCGCAPAAPMMYAQPMGCCGAPVVGCVARSCCQQRVRRARCRPVRVRRCRPVRRRRCCR